MAAGGYAYPESGLQKIVLHGLVCLTHWSRVTHICVSNLTIIGSDNGLSPGRCQAITWTNVGILLIGPLGTNFSEMLIEIHTFSFKKIHLKISSGKWQPFCFGLNVLRPKFMAPLIISSLVSPPNTNTVRFLAATKQLYEWFSLSVHLSCHTVFTVFPSWYRHEIFRSYYHWQKWCPCKRSRS